jgi:outer membrane protein assembly factor BamA
MLRTGLLVLLMTTIINPLFAEGVERRKDQFGRDFGYYVYPIAGEIPGIGTAAGLGASVLNMAEGDTDITAYYIRGDFDASGVAVLDYHVIPKRLIFDVGYNDYNVAATRYDRGIDSDPDNVIYPSVQGSYLMGQMSLTFDERRYEIYLRALGGSERLIKVLDKDGQAFEGIDTEWKFGKAYVLGGSVDLTDDRLDPRKGMRFEFSSRLPTSRDADQSEYFVNDYNLTGYVPMRRWDTLAFNLFYSNTIITREGETDFATLQQSHGLNCSQYPPGADYDACVQTESKLLNGMISDNRYGTASSLGGTQRLRSFDNGRFYAADALFYGVEYRWNLTDERTPFNIYVAKGIRTGIQLAAFWEQGTVADHSADLFDNIRNSYGVGFRMILSGVIIRFDYSGGEEGPQSQLFITYPWSMFSVDDPA